MAIGTSGYIESVHLQRQPNEDIYEAQKTDTLLRGAASFVSSLGKAAEGLDSLLGPSAVEIAMESGRINQRLIGAMEATNTTEEKRKVLSDFTQEAKDNNWRDIHLQTVASTADKYISNSVQQDAILKKQKEIDDVSSGLALYANNLLADGGTLSDVTSFIGDQKGWNKVELTNSVLAKMLNGIAIDIANTNNPDEYKAKLNKAKLVFDEMNTPQLLGNRSSYSSKYIDGITTQFNNSVKEKYNELLDSYSIVGAKANQEPLNPASSLAVQTAAASMKKLDEKKAAAMEISFENAYQSALKKQQVDMDKQIKYNAEMTLVKASKEGYPITDEVKQAFNILYGDSPLSYDNKTTEYNEYNQANTLFVAAKNMNNGKVPSIAFALNDKLSELVVKDSVVKVSNFMTTGQRDGSSFNLHDTKVAAEASKVVYDSFNEAIKSGSEEQLRGVLNKVAMLTPEDRKAVLKNELFLKAQSILAVNKHLPKNKDGSPKYSFSEVSKLISDSEYQKPTGNDNKVLNDLKESSESFGFQLSKEFKTTLNSIYSVGGIDAAKEYYNSIDSSIVRKGSGVIDGKFNNVELDNMKDLLAGFNNTEYDYISRPITNGDVYVYKKGILGLELQNKISSKDWNTAKNKITEPRKATGFENDLGTVSKVIGDVAAPVIEGVNKSYLANVVKQTGKGISDLYNVAEKYGSQYMSEYINSIQNNKGWSEYFFGKEETK